MIRISLNLAIICVILAITKPIIAQERQQFDLQYFIESRFNNQQTTLNYEELYERLLLLYENPLDVNTATEEQLMSLSLLSQSQLASFFEYRYLYGQLVTIYELQYIEGFDQETVTALLPFVTIESPNQDRRPLLERILSEQNNSFILRYERTLETKEGYTFSPDSLANRYAGTPNKAYLRYRVSNSGDFSFGFTTEKDAGERVAWSPSQRIYGADFWSAHLMIEKKGKWRKMIIGDYQLQLGQGLVFGSGFGIGKGSETTNSLERASLGILPYTSVIEGGFLRGAAATYELNKKLSSTIFLSRLKQDAGIQTGSDENFENYFSSIRLSGFHRTESEIESKHNITESVVGLNLDYKPNQQTKIGIVASLNQFNIPILRSNQAYNHFEFSGLRNHNLSLYTNTQWQRFRFFGEAAISKSNGLGGVIGFTTSLSKRVDFGMLIRQYDRDFHSIQGASFAEGSRNINESGVYWGLKYKLNKQFNLSAYYDSFRFPWLRFRINTPSSGHDYLLRLNYSPKPNTRFYVQMRQKTRSENIREAETNIQKVMSGDRSQYIFNLQYYVTTNTRLQSRVQFSDFEINNQRTSGYAMMQDLDFKISNLSLSTRFAVFDTEGQQNRQYAYERDVLYAFSIPAYSGRGIRNYLLLSYKASRQIDVWARLARTTFYDRTEIGTGLETIDGNKRTDFKFQIRYKIR